MRLERSLGIWGCRLVILVRRRAPSYLDISQLTRNKRVSGTHYTKVALRLPRVASLHYRLAFQYPEGSSERLESSRRSADVSFISDVCRSAKRAAREPPTSASLPSAARPSVSSLRNYPVFLKIAPTLVSGCFAVSVSSSAIHLKSLSLNSRSHAASPAQ